MVGNQPSGTKACPRCNSSAHLQAAFCSVCGHSFQAPYQQQPPVAAQPHWDPYGPARPDSNKLLVTLLLWFFLGNFGAHRFYLGHINTAATMLVLELIGFATACILIGYIPLLIVGIWWIIDLVLMLTGQLTPTDGSRIV